MRSWRAYQLADDPESAATMALSGISSLSSQISRMGLTMPGRSLPSMAWRSIVCHQRATLASIFSRQDRSDFRSSKGSSAVNAAAESDTTLTS